MLYRNKQEWKNCVKYIKIVVEDKINISYNVMRLGKRIERKLDFLLFYYIQYCKVLILLYLGWLNYVDYCVELVLNR